MRDDYLASALKVIPDANILVNVVSRRVKQLARGNRPLVESLEKLSNPDIALREIAEGKIGYELGPMEQPHAGDDDGAPGSIRDFREGRLLRSG